jgi:hypothetical protein
VYFDATLSVLPPRLPPSVPCYVDRNPPTESTSHELSDPSAFPDESALLFTHRLMRVRRVLPDSPKVPPVGFGYPFDGVRNSHPWEPLSVPNALGFRPLEPFSSPEIENLFRSFLSALAFSYETSQASYRRFSGLLPPEKPCPLLPPDGLGRDGTACSSERYDLSGISLRRTYRKT